MPKAIHVSSLEDHLGYWLRYVSNQVSHAFGLKVAARDVTVAEWVMLRELYEQDSMVPSAIAGRLGMTRGAISKLADRLSAKALLARVPGTKDRRYQELALTAAGRALVPELSDFSAQNNHDLNAGLHGFGDEVREGLAPVTRSTAGALESLWQALSPTEENRS